MNEPGPLTPGRSGFRNAPVRQPCATAENPPTCSYFIDPYTGRYFNSLLATQPIQAPATRHSWQRLGFFATSSYSALGQEVGEIQGNCARALNARAPTTRDFGSLFPREGTILPPKSPCPAAELRVLSLSPISAIVIGACSNEDGWMDGDRQLDPAGIKDRAAVFPKLLPASDG
jgi:hypothetical protein